MERVNECGVAAEEYGAADAEGATSAVADTEWTKDGSEAVKAAASLCESELDRLSDDSDSNDCTEEAAAEDPCAVLS